RTEAEAQRLAALEEDLRLAARAFQQFLADVTTAFSGVAAGQDDRTARREAEALMSDPADLAPGTVLLHTLLTDERDRVIITTPKGQVARDAAITAAALNCHVYAFREVLETLTVKDGAPAYDPRPLAQALYQILMGPVAGDLDGAQAQTLVWVLD